MKSILPEWLDGRTVALLAAFIALGALIQTSFASMRQDMNQLGTELRDEIDGVRTELRTEIRALRDELKGDIGRLDDRLRVVEVDVAAIRSAMMGFEARLSAVEEHARHDVEPISAARREG